VGRFAATPDALSLHTRTPTALEPTLNGLDVGRAEVEDIESTLAVLAGRLQADPPLRLRFDNSWPRTGPGPALLAGALMGSFDDYPLDVDAADDAAVAGMRWFGVAAALQRRRGDNRYCRAASKLDDRALGVTWRPGISALTELLFAETDQGEQGSVGPRHANFVNAHLAVTSSGTSDVTYLVRRWLTRRLLERFAEDLHGLRRTVDQVGTVVEQLVSNVREHAAAGLPSGADSLLRLALLDHPGRGAVSCSVIDTGPGIEATLVPKLSAQDRDRERASVLGALCQGQLRGWGRARGLGLAKVTELVREAGGQLDVATEQRRVRVRDGQLVTETASFSLRGTVVSLTFPLPQA